MFNIAINKMILYNIREDKLFLIKEKGITMKKLIMILMILLSISAFAAYNIGDTVDPSDNISWTITGPAGHPEVGNSSTIFDQVALRKPVMIFLGGYG